ncbi:Uncharacterised protein [Enterobacter hormaechei]|uniref:ead/Ea22-like family protein n=1 Tax=Enterobacter hormaechei TaxID=158836 RepID=UPI00125986D2|nr:ead/Ea22-like family protein [Enterobacter hormaechei]VAC52167.1 Uncharacterised protein [Enterobacter hormaechei]
MSNIDKQKLREAAEKALPAMKRLLMMPNDELFDEALLNVDGDVDAANAFNLLTGPETVLALLDELEAAEKRIAELPGQKRLIGWRMADYTDETADPALAKNWANVVDVLPIFEGDVNTKLTAAAAGKGEAS